MELMEAILTRRSIRKFDPERAVPQAMIDELIKAAMYAPSAMGQAPWEFVVLTDRKLLDGITEFHPHAVMCKQAPLGIAVCGNLEKCKKPGAWMLDCSAATQNMLLAGHAMGLGGVWVGVWPNDDRVPNIQKMLNLPEHVLPLCINVFGYPAQTPKQPDRMDTSAIHYNGW